MKHVARQYLYKIHTFNKFLFYKNISKKQQKFPIIIILFNFYNIFQQKYNKTVQFLGNHNQQHVGLENYVTNLYFYLIS